MKKKLLKYLEHIIGVLAFEFAISVVEMERSQLYATISLIFIAIMIIKNEQFKKIKKKEKTTILKNVMESPLYYFGTMFLSFVALGVFK